MTFEERRKIFCENLKLLNKNFSYLLKSYKKAQNVDFSKGELTEDEIEVLEVLSNRFSRTVDMLINKVLRSLDLLELEDTNRKLDIVIRAEKRGFVDSYDLLIELKDLRNELAHEYIQEKLLEKFKEVLEKTPIVADIIAKVNEYSTKMGYC
jgi:uncharacterized protein YutE (UPF0331/DUF86 family)